MTAGRSSHHPVPDLVAEAQAHACAVRVVAARATDADECVELLAMLGLEADLARPSSSRG